MAHIAIDARIINSSTGRYVERLIFYLEKIDTTNTYTILVRKKDESFYTPANKNFTIKVADFDNYSLAEQFSFKKFLDALSPDLVHFCMPQQPILYNGAKITTFHDLTLLNTYNSDKNWLVYHFKQTVGRFVFKHVARSNPTLLSPTQFTKDELVKFAGISPNKVVVTYEAADPPATSPKPYPLPFKEYIMYVGQQPDYKNIRHLAAAHQKLLQNHPNLGLVLVGKKAADTLANEAFFAAKGYKNITFTGFVDDHELTWLYKNTKVYVFPSLMEGFGLPGLEAMASGAPVASSNATCLPEVYGDAAHYFSPVDTKTIAEAIDDILTNKPLRDELIKKGYKQVEKYSWRRMAEQTHAEYLKILTKTSGQ